MALNNNLDAFIYAKLLAYAESFYEWHNKTLCSSIPLPDYEILVNKLLDKFLIGKIRTFAGFKRSLRNGVIGFSRLSINREFKKIPFEDWMKNTLLPPGNGDDDNDEDDNNADDDYEVKNFNDDHEVEHLFKMINFLDELENSIVGNHFKDKAIIAKLIEITKKLEIDCFLGIPINEIACLAELNKAARQNKDFHRKKFNRLVQDCIQDDKNKEILRFLSISTFEKEDDFSAGHLSNSFAEKGREYKEIGKNLHALYLGVQSDEVEQFEHLSESKILMISLLQFLKASILFKQSIIENPKYIRARYNYAYCLKRLGKLNDSIDEMKDCLKNLNSSHDINIRGLINEGIGDAYLLSGKFDTANYYFKEALLDSPDHIQIKCNVLESYFRIGSIEGIIKWQEKLIVSKISIPLLRQPLFYQLLNTYKFNKTIVANCIKILNF